MFGFRKTSSLRDNFSKELGIKGQFLQRVRVPLNYANKIIPITTSEHNKNLCSTLMLKAPCLMPNENLLEQKLW